MSFNSFVSAGERQLSRLGELIATAGQVLATHKPPPTIYGFATLDEEAFSRWQAQCLVLLTDLFGDDHAYVERFRSTVAYGQLESVQAGRAILAVVREDVAPAHRLGVEAPVAAEAFTDVVGTGERPVIRVLHIDDAPAIRLLFRVNLEAEAGSQGGWEAIEAADGLTGVRLAKRERPDLILLNVNLPKLDGWEVAEELLKDQQTRDIPIVFLTARAEFRDRARGFDLGAVDYILKPFDPVALALRIREILERLERGERDELRRELASELRALMGAE